MLRGVERVHTAASIVDRILRQARTRLHFTDLWPRGGVQLVDVLRHVRDISGMDNMVLDLLF